MNQCIPNLPVMDVLARLCAQLEDILVPSYYRSRCQTRHPPATENSTCPQPLYQISTWNCGVAVEMPISDSPIFVTSLFRGSSLGCLMEPKTAPACYLKTPPLAAVHCRSELWSHWKHGATKESVLVPIPLPPGILPRVSGAPEISGSALLTHEQGKEIAQRLNRKSFDTAGR